MTRIKELRESLGIKQEELAMLCGVTQSTISLWEIGRTVPRKRALEKLAERFGVSAGYILGIENAEVQDIQRLDLSEDELVLLERYRALGDEDKELLRSDALRMKREAEKGTGYPSEQSVG